MSLTAPEEIDEPDPCPACGRTWEGIYQCRNCGWGEPEETPTVDADARTEEG